MTRAWTLPLGLLVWCSSCGAPDFRPRSWDPIDPEATVWLTQNPTAEISASEADAIATRTVVEAARLVRTAAWTSDVLESLGVGAAIGRLDGVRVPRAGLEGTSVRLEIGCPGEEISGADATYRHGTLRVDSPALSLEVLERLRFEGQLLGAFEPGEDSKAGCRVADTALEGRAPGYYDAEIPLTILTFDGVLVTDLVEGDTGESYETSDTVVIDSAGPQLIRMIDDGTHFVARFPDGTQPGVLFTLHAANADYACRLEATGTARCDAL